MERQAQEWAKSRRGPEAGQHVDAVAPISVAARPDSLARVCAERSKVPDLRQHDLRRTAASLMTGMGISRLAVKKILNHAERDVTAVYDRHSYDPEKRTALEAWGRRLETIVSGAKGREKIVALGRRAR